MDTGDMIARKIEALIAERGMNNRAVAIAAGMSPTGVRDIITRKTKNPTFANLIKIADVLGVSVYEIVGDPPSPHYIAIAGKVGAGAHVPVFDAYGKEGDGPQVEAPPGLPTSDIVAVEIEGDSMEPVYSAGDLLFYSRPAAEGIPTEAIGRRCVCECEKGLGWVKQVKLGSEPGLFNLISLNPGAENQHDVRLKWAAPVRLHWPADLARRVG